ncbi:MAG: PEP-CTERM sorting domain-containing protein [Armatimonadetes bacterium]|nr:PEP-CTERM sorting domain-containing protein [Armatimonadota bacterium]
MKRLVLLPLTLTLASTAFSTVYDAFTDWAPANPNGVWSYGYTNSLGSAWNPFTIYWSGNPDAWADPSLQFLGVYRTVAGYSGGTTTCPAAMNVLHPGVNGQYAVARFTAPTTGTYNYSAGFFGIDWGGPTTTDVHVLLNGVAIQNGAINSFAAAPTVSFGGPISLTAGDTLDVAAGFGGDGYFNDSTAFKFRIENVPEPASLLVIAGLAALAKRRRS